MGTLWRFLWTWLASTWRPPIGVRDTVVRQRRVGLLDLDFNAHMNHARYLTVVEQTLLEGLQRSGFLATLWSEGAFPMLGGTLISHRRELKPFERYRVQLRHLGADTHWHVFAFRFIAADGRVAALGLVKGAGVRRRAPRGLMPATSLWQAHAQRHAGLADMPVLPAEACAWLQAERLSTDAWAA